jgi:hypothetical protein
LEEKRKRWSRRKKLAVYPGYVAGALLLFFMWIVIGDTISPPRIIDGRADDAPRMAALFSED